jgi:hypothetical protein
MPILREQMQRMSIIYREIKNRGPVTCKHLHSKVNSIVDRPVCKSTIEKDLFKLKMDFDVEFISSRRGYVLADEVDFVDKVVEYFNIEL